MSETLPVEASAYRAAMARLASAVHLVTTDGPGGRAGFTASAVCSVTDAPPTLLVCVNRDSSAHAAISRNESLCVNTLCAEQQPVADAFGGKVPMAERFAAGTWHEEAGAAPVLAGALVAFRCRIANRATVGTHDVLFCEVVGLIGPGETDALVYADRRYHTLPRTNPGRPSPARSSPEPLAPPRTRALGAV